MIWRGRPAGTREGRGAKLTALRGEEKQTFGLVWAETHTGFVEKQK